MTVDTLDQYRLSIDKQLTILNGNISIITLANDDSRSLSNLFGSGDIPFSVKGSTPLGVATRAGLALSICG